MGAHRLYCYAPQHSAVVEFLEGIGAIVTRDSPRPIHDREQIVGIENLNFVVVKDHVAGIPQSLWDHIVERGAVIVEVDKQYIRDGKLPVRHVSAG